MSSLDFNEVLLAKLAGWEAMKEARRLVADGRISGAEWNPPRLTGLVREGTSTYRTGLVIRSATDADNLCPCRASRQRGLICAHAIAVGLHYLRPPTPPPAAFPAPALAPALASAAQTPPSPPVRSVRRLRRSGPDKTAESLEIAVIFPSQLPAAIAQGRVTLHFEGTWAGGRRPLAMAPMDRTFALSEEDTRLLDAIEAVAGGDTPGLLMLTPPQLAQVLPALVGHPRLSLGKTQPVRVLPQPLALKVRASLASSGEILLEAATGATGPCVCSDTHAWTFLNPDFVPLDLPPALRELLSGPVRIPRSRVPHFLLTDWPALVARGGVEPDFDPGDLEFDTSPPSFNLHLAGGLGMLDATLECRYGDRVLSPGAAAADETAWLVDSQHPTRYQARDLAAERDAFAWLVRAGFAGPNARGQWRMRGPDNVLNFFTRDYPRMQKVWRVRLDERLERSTGQQLERIEPRFEIRPSGTQWFDLGIVYQSASGEQLEPADIQRLLRSGQGRTRLRNGRWGVLDTEAIDDWQQVLADANPRQEGGRYRLDAAQAGFLDATLREQPAWQVRAPAAWSERAAPARGEARLDPPPMGALDLILRPYQKTGVAWLRFLRANGFGGILADDMGLGKTVQVLAHLEVLRAAGQLNGPTLVVAPTSVVSNWEIEARRFTPGLRVLLLHGPARQSLFERMPQQHLVITSYALARRDAPGYAGLEFDTVILDEAQHIKNPGTQNAQVVKSVRSRHRLVLTGTPVENTVRDLWSIFDFLMPGYLGSAGDFRERYEAPILQAGDLAVRRRLARRLRPFVLRRLKRDVAQDLPPRLEQVSYCELTAQQRAAYRQVLEASRREILAAAGQEQQPRNRMLVLTALLRLRQIACDLRLVQPESPAPGAAADVPATSGKVELFNELIEEALDGGHRVLVFSQFTAMLALLKPELEQRGIAYGYLDGETRDRPAVIERFQRDAGIPVFLISLKAGGTGLNLTGADTVIHFDPWWNPAIEAQATDRAHRIGQRRVVTSYKLIARDTVEDKILQLQSRKGALARDLLGDESSFASALSWDEIRDLLGGG
jgi:superfamily II DNA or RNA helicase